MAITITNPKAKQVGVYALLAVAILLPLLKPGYILTLDMVFTPRLPIPDTVTSSYLFRVLLHVLDLLLPADLIQKLMLFTILVVSGFGMHRFMLYTRLDTPPVVAYLAGFLYMVNPYTYSRFMAGQYSVLLGYALLPLLCRAFLRLLATPTTSSSLKLAGWIVLISVVSIHTMGLVAVLVLVGAGLQLWRKRQQKPQLIKFAKSLLVAGGAVFLASSYWLVPLLAGQGKTADTIQSFSTGDQNAFATAGGNIIGKIANIVRLQGFWAEGRGLFLLPQDNVPAWGLLVIGVWVLVFMGGRRLWRMHYRFLTAWLGFSALMAVILASGLLSIPGFREPHKFVGLLALMYAVFAAHGAGKLITAYTSIKAYVVTACCFVLVVGLTPTMFWGFGGQLTASQYPASWAAANQTLNADQDKFQTVFLPWHLYMHFKFAGRIIANPAPDFFDKPVLVSNDPEFAGAALTSNDPIVQQLREDILTKAPVRQDLGTQLSRQRIKYVIFARESDAPDYDYLDNQHDLELVQETEDLRLYRNKAWED